MLVFSSTARPTLCTANAITVGTRGTGVLLLIAQTTAVVPSIAKNIHVEVTLTCRTVGPVGTRRACPVEGVALPLVAPDTTILATPVADVAIHRGGGKRPRGRGPAGHAPVPDTATGAVGAGGAGQACGGLAGNIVPIVARIALAAVVEAKRLTQQNG